MVSTEQIRRAIIEFQTRGEAKAQAALDAVADGQRKVAATGQAMSVVDDTVVKRKIALIANADKLRARYDTEYAVIRKVAREQLTLELAMAKAGEQAAQYGAQIDAIRVKLGDLADGSAEFQSLIAQQEKARESAEGYSRAIQLMHERFGINGESAAAAPSMSADELEKLVEKYNPLIRAANNYRRAIEEINQANAAGAFSQEADYSSTIERTTTAYNRQAKAIKQMEQGGKSLRLTTFELTNLSYQANDAATMLLSGSSAFQVFATQGGQVYQILAGSEGGLVGGLKDTGKALTSLLSPARLAGGAIVGAAALAVTSYASWIAAEKQLQLALEGRGRATKATTADLMAIAGAAADAGNVTVSEAREIAAALASTGKIGTDLYGGLIDATRNFATVTQQELPAAAKEIADAFADPAKGAEKLNDKLAFLDTATLTYIRDLAASNRGHEAANLLLQKLNGVLPDASQNLTALGRAWKGVANFASNAYDAMGRGIGRLLEGPGLEEEIAGIEARLKELNSAAGKSGRYGQYDQSRERVELEQRLTELSDKRSKMEARSADAAKKAAEDTARSIAGAHDPRIKQLEDLKTAYQGVTKAITENAGDVEQLTRIREGIVNQIGTIASGDMSKGADTVKLIPATEQLRREQDLLMASVTAYTPAQRAAAAAEQARYDALKRGASSAEASLEAENARAKELAQANVALTTAQRDRLLAGEENIASQQLEIDLIGKTAGEAAELRANYQAYWDLKREALENGTELDKDQLELMKAQNKELGKTAELRAKAGLWADINKERAAIGRSPTEQAIYDRLESAGLKPDLESAEAAALRLNETLSLTKDIATDAFSDLINDLIDGENAMESLQNAAKRLLGTLVDLAAQNVMAGLFGKAGTGGGADWLTSLVGGFLNFGSSGSSAPVGVVGGNGPFSVPTFLAEGGPVEGPGTGTSDSIVARLSNGEFVINARAAAQHRGLLEAVNNGGMPAFASGGSVGRAAAHLATYATDGGGSAGDAALKVVVNTLPGETAEVSRTSDGGVQIDIRKMVRGEMQAAFEDGAFDRVGARRFGWRRVMS